MIIMLPTTSEQTISVKPGKSDTVGQVDVTIIQDGYKNAEILSNVTVVEQSYYYDVTFACNLLKEGETYFLEITNDNELWYRDKIYATSQTDFKVKHIISQSEYTQYDNNETFTVID